MNGVDVVEDDQVGALLLDLHAAHGLVQADGVDRESRARLESVVAPRFRPVLADGPGGHVGIEDGQAVGLEQRLDAGRQVGISLVLRV